MRSLTAVQSSISDTIHLKVTTIQLKEAKIEDINEWLIYSLTNLKDFIWCEKELKFTDDRL